MSLIKRQPLPGRPSFIQARKPLDLCDMDDAALQALFDEIVEKEKRGAAVMGPRGRTAVFAEINKRKMCPHLRR